MRQQNLARLIIFAFYVSDIFRKFIMQNILSYPTIYMGQDN
jgi:hypothetical protein